jgi:hypothetical protein
MNIKEGFGKSNKINRESLSAYALMAALFILLNKVKGYK